MSVEILRCTEVGPADIQLGDRLSIGGQLRPVIDMWTLPRSGKRLHFQGGACLTLRRDDVVSVERTLAPRHPAKSR